MCHYLQVKIHEKEITIADNFNLSTPVIFSLVNGSEQIFQVSNPCVYKVCAGGVGVVCVCVYVCVLAVIMVCVYIYSITCIVQPPM